VLTNIDLIILLIRIAKCKIIDWYHCILMN